MFPRAGCPAFGPSTYCFLHFLYQTFSFWRNHLGDWCLTCLGIPLLLSKHAKSNPPANSSINVQSWDWLLMRQEAMRRWKSRERLEVGTPVGGNHKSEGSGGGENGCWCVLGVRTWERGLICRWLLLHWQRLVSGECLNKHCCDFREKDNRMRIMWCGVKNVWWVLDMIIWDTRMVDILVFCCYWRNCYRKITWPRQLVRESI